MGRKKPGRQGADGARASQELIDAPLAARGLFSESYGLRLLVFWAGAVLMGLEIAGSRVLAPHFGNSIFVWGSLISIFLVALSVGYYLGGMIADRYPSRLVLNSICMVVSLWIFALALFAYPFCQALAAAGLGEQSGPLVASLVLFLPPSVGMGMVSPIAIRLATQSVSSVGKSAGTLYALSTLGSIVGTLLTTFVLVPLIGLSAILKSLGLALLLVSLITLPLRRNPQALTRTIVVGLFALAMLLWPAPDRNPLAAGEEMIVDVDTPYQHISVIDNAWRHSRELRFDRFVESAILLDKQRAYPTLSGYTNYFHLALLANPKIERTLFIGAGGGVGPRAFHTHNPQMAIDVVDIDGKVLEVARDYFYLNDSPQIRLIAQDGRMFMRQTANRYDCVILDAFTVGGRIPFHLVTKEFLELCRSKMTESGVFVMNINSALEGPHSLIYHTMQRTLAAVFPQVYAFGESHVGRVATQSMNVILLASNGSQRMTPEQWRARAAQHQSKAYVGRDLMLRAVQDLLPAASEPGGGTIFTDDFAPIETMPF
jgi:spermidine synthase